MRVYEYGHIAPRYAFRTGCGAILEFTKMDMKLSNIHLWKGPQNNGRDYLVNCPVCGRVIYDAQFRGTPEEC